MRELKLKTVNSLKIYNQKIGSGFFRCHYYVNKDYSEFLKRPKIQVEKERKPP